MLTSIPSIYQDTYGESVGIAGLHYFALGVGLSGASQTNARLLDRIYKHFKEKNGGRGRPEFRLRKHFVFFPSYFVCLSTNLRFLLQRLWYPVLSSSLLGSC